MAGWKLAALLIGALLVAACSSDNTDDLAAFIARQQTIDQAASLPVFDVAQKPLSTYSAADLRSPFERASTQPDIDQLAPFERANYYLVQFTIDKLRMVGTLHYANQLWVLIQDPQAIIHRFRVGDYIGRQRSEIVAIDDSAISLRELIVDRNGERVERYIAMMLQR